MSSKLDQAARFRLDIEVFFEDLDYLAQTLPGCSLPEKRLNAARHIRAMCDDRGISIVCLQPFMGYEGLLDRNIHRQRVADFRHWIQLAKMLRTNIISIPSTTLSVDEASGDKELIVQDMQEVADLAAPHGIKVAYEALAWGTHVDTWEEAWEVVALVNRWNFGICLDTFNIAGRVYADPTAMSGKNPNASEDMRSTLRSLVKIVDVSKIFYVQVVDAQYLKQPLLEGHPYYNSSQPSRMSWSRTSRLFYGEEDLGAYLPIKDILFAILNELGFEGWISAELFNHSLTEEAKSVPEHHAGRAVRSFQKLSRDLNVDLSQAEQVQSKQRANAEQIARPQL